VGGPLWWGWGWPYPLAYSYAYGYPYGYAYAYPDPVYAEAPVYVEQSRPAQRELASGYWYYCTDPAGYYPYVQSCTQPWMQVAPQPAPPSPDQPAPVQ
jgi:hypothetical protein